MKKFLLAVLFCFSLTLSAFGLVACDQGNGGGESGQTEFQKVYSQYVINAKAAGETPLSYEAWLLSIKGEKGDTGESGAPGKDGITPKLRINATTRKWEVSYDDGETWQDLEVVAEGTQGEPGKTAYELYCEAYPDYDGTLEEWLASLQGKDGENGTSGVGIKKVELNADGDLLITFTDDSTQIVEMPKKHEHEFGEWTPYDTYSYCENRLHVRRCNDCNVIEWKMGTADDHDWADSYSSNNTYHWIACKNCGKRLNEEEHSFLNASCQVCGKIRVSSSSSSKSSSKSSSSSSSSVVLYGVSLDKTETTLEVGQTLTLVATTNPANYNGTATWASTNTDVATAQNGVVTALAEGMTTIKVKYGTGSSAKSAACTITVEKVAPCTSVSLNKSSVSLGVGGTETLVATTNPTDTTDTISWFTDDPSVATVANGIVTAVDVGSTTITVQCGDQMATCSITVGPTDGVLYEVVGDIARVVGYEGTATRVRLAETYENAPVTEICANVFKNLSIASVIIPDSVTSIGGYAFYDCDNLTSIEIPDGVTYIGVYAFSNCTNLTSVNYTGTIDDWAQISFASTTSNPLLYADNFYIQNELVTEINLTTATKISYYAFHGYDKLMSVVIGDSVESICGEAFSWCRNLTSVVIGDSVTSIGEYAFDSCYNLTSVVIGEGVESIGEDSFSSCYNLTFNKHGNANYLPSKTNPYFALISVTNKNYSTYTIHQDTKIIAPSAFYDCANLTSVVIGDSVTSISDYAFSDCTNLTSVYYKGTASDWADISIGFINSDLTSATRYYYIENQADVPTDGGKYWHYENGVPAAW